MRCPRMGELPAAPPGKTGWPWTEESEQLPSKIPDGSPWPKVSIVTPSYNQGQVLEKTIQSVVVQSEASLGYTVEGTTARSEEVMQIRVWTESSRATARMSSTGVE